MIFTLLTLCYSIPGQNPEGPSASPLTRGIPNHIRTNE